MYNHKNIEAKWQKHWYDNNIFATKKDSKKNIYILDMFPYPSGAGLHVGHLKGYTASDVFSHYKRLNNFNVLHPMGWDSFGLPAEQYALKTGNNPKTFIKKNIKNFKKQLKSVGLSYDFDKEINTTDPEYYKWTQWIFLQLYKKGLAEYKEINVNWCEKLGTVLANEEVLVDASGNNVSERGNYPVIQRPMKQWVLKITNYAEKLLEGLDKLDWTNSLISLQKNWIGFEKTTNGYTTKLHDWVFSRQRFWGEPFPIAFDNDNNVYLIDKLPVLLPETNQRIQPSYDGTSPLSNFKEWLYFKNPTTGRKMRRETNTMPQWAGSSWYYLAYILKTKNNFIPLNSKKAYEEFKKWLPVDIYIGGQEHAVLHLLYARFWHKVLYDIGIVPTSEPFAKLINQGMILASDGQKMSKSKNNGQSPDEIIAKFGADTLRLYEMFMGPVWDDKKWDDVSLLAMRKWIDKIFNYFSNLKNVDKNNEKFYNPEIHKLIKKITINYDNFKFNIAISNLMVMFSYIIKNKLKSEKIIQTFFIMLFPIAPHISSELLMKLINCDIFSLQWPKYLNNLAKEHIIKIPVQINGRLRGVLELNEGHNKSNEDVIKMALKIKSVQKYTKKSKIRKQIFINNKIINFVI